MKCEFDPYAKNQYRIFTTYRHQNMCEKVHRTYSEGKPDERTQVKNFSKLKIRNY